MSKLNIVIKLTTSCPANCVCCTNRKKEFKEKGEINSVFNISIFEKICANIRNMGADYICLSGGEPTIIPNINEYFEIAHSNKLAVRINTNGWGVNEEKMKKWISLGLEQIVLSVYSLNRESIKKIRGNDNLYYKSINAASVIKKLKTCSFAFIVQTVIMKENYMEIAEVLNYAINNKADFFWPSYLEDAVNLPTVQLKSDDVKIFRNEILPAMKKVIDEKIQSDTHKNQLNLCIDNYYENEFNNYIYHDDNYECDWLGRHLTLYPNGTVYPCPGHEYFTSKGQQKLDYRCIDSIINIDYIKEKKQNKFPQCKYCPQGAHQELRLYER